MQRIIFNSKETEYKSLFGALPTNKKCTFNIDILSSENPTGASLCVRADEASGHTSFPMEYTETHGEYMRFSADVSFDAAGLYFYRFDFT